MLANEINFVYWGSNKLVKTFEHYPAVTLKDGKDYILSYLEDESCGISEKEIGAYLLKNHAEITKDNIHLYYEFMDKKDLDKHGDFGDLLHSVLTTRRAEVDDIINVPLEDFSFSYGSKGNWTSYNYFGVEDTLKPLHDYIEEIKESDGYKKYVAENSLNKTEHVLIDKDNWKLIKNDVEADYSYYLQNKNTEDIPAKANSFIGIKIYLNKSTDNNDLKEFEKELDEIIVAEKLKEQYDYIENIIFKPISSNNLFSSKLELKDNIFNRFEYQIDLLMAQNEKTFIVQINNVIDLKIAHSANDL